PAQQPPGYGVGSRRGASGSPPSSLLECLLRVGRRWLAPLGHLGVDRRIGPQEALLSQFPPQLGGIGAAFTQASHQISEIGGELSG
ncbi:MAG TPA: hypothetical protein VK689_18515, partial [Armatimonadota bacterium]|nr:hypothetical protein [Armatimonadota bacterium]